MSVIASADIADLLGPAAKELLAAWSLLPKHEHVPYRESFDPMLVARILPVITLLQRVSDEEWHFRLVGTEVDRRWGKPQTGQLYRHCRAGGGGDHSSRVQ